MVSAIVSPVSAMATTTRLSFMASPLAFRIVGVASGSRAVNASFHPPRSVRTVELRTSILTLYVPAATLIASPETAAASACSTLLHGARGYRQAFPTSLPRRETQRSVARLAAGSTAAARTRSSVRAKRVALPLSRMGDHSASDEYKSECESQRCARAGRVHSH